MTSVSANQIYTDTGTKSKEQDGQGQGRHYLLNRRTLPFYQLSYRSPVPANSPFVPHGHIIHYTDTVSDSREPFGLIDTEVITS